MATTPVLWKGQTQANTSDGGWQQVYGQIVPLAGGGYAVMWIDESGVHNPIPGRYAIVGQRYDALGNKVGGEMMLSRLEDDSLPTTFYHAVTTLSDGRIAIAFTDAVVGNLYVQIFNSTLTKLLRTDIIGDSGASNPSLTALAGGAYAVSWTSTNSATDDDVLGRVVSTTGSMGASFEIGAPGDGNNDRQDRSESATLSNGNVVTVYHDEFLGSTTDRDIAFSIRQPNGTLVDENTVAGGGGTADEIRPDVAALKGGGFAVVWTDASIDGSGAGIGAAVYDNLGEVTNAGGVGLPGIRVNTTTAGNQSNATVVALADGGFLVAWEDYGAGLMRGQRFDKNGGKIGAEFTLNNTITVGGTEAAIRMALLSDGRVAIVANRFQGGDYDVLTSIWDPRTGPVNGTAAGEILTSTPGGATVNGLGGNDTLIGRAANDTLNGGTGADLMRGGAGNDTYIVDNAGDVVDESTAGSNGTDTVRASISFSLADAARVKGSVENLTLIGAASINATGNALANIITGNTGDNILNGRDGADNLSGRDGVDTLAGGLGNDVLTGGPGFDRFLFDTKPAKNNIDVVTDFSPLDDTILLENAVFKKLKKVGELKGKFFHEGKKAKDGNDYVIHNPRNGNLIYDKNGDDKGGAKVVANLGDGLHLTKADFFVI